MTIHMMSFFDKVFYYMMNYKVCLQNMMLHREGLLLPQKHVISSSQTPSFSAPYEEDEGEDDFGQLACR